MPIDFLKIFVKDKDLISRLQNNPILEWLQIREGLSHIEKEAQEGIIKATTTKVYKGIVFCFKEDSLIIYFKPHYYYNNNKHNANDFTINACINVIREFLRDLSLENEGEKLIVQNIEFGLNVLSPINIKDLITFLAYHKKNEFRTDVGLLYSKKSYSLSKNGKASKYLSLKAYAKGLQFPEYADPDSFRFELKSQESRKINSLGIFNINDLLKPDVYTTLAEELIQRFDEVLILDSSVELDKLEPKKRLKLVEMLNTHFWYKQLQKSRNTFNDSKKTYFSLLNTAGYNIHNDLRKILLSKVEELKYCADAETPIKDKNCADADIYIIRNCTTNGSEYSAQVKDAAYIKELSTDKDKDSIIAQIEDYALQQLISNINNPDHIKPEKLKGEYFYNGGDVEKVIAVTFSEVEQNFKEHYSLFNLHPSCSYKNYFGFPGAQAMGWMKDDVLERFRSNFYISAEQ